MKKRIYFFLLYLFVLGLYPSVVHAQSANELYRIGVSKMQPKTKQACRDAIPYFESAIEIGKGNNKLIKDCKNRISECRNIINPPSPNPNHSGSSQSSSHERRRPIDSTELEAFRDTVYLGKIKVAEKGTIPIKSSKKWESVIESESAFGWLMVKKDVKARRPTLSIALSNPDAATTHRQEARVRVKGTGIDGNPFNESFIVVLEERAERPVIIDETSVVTSLQFKKGGGQEIVKLPRNTAVSIPESGSWCFKSELKYKTGKKKFQRTLLKVSNYLVKLLGGMPKMELCGADEFVIEAYPNKTGSVRSTVISLPDNKIINVSQSN